MKTAGLVSLLFLVACTTGSVSDDMPPGDDSSGGTDLSGSITADRTVSGGVNLTDSATVETGVTLTVAGGAVLEATGGKNITVKGTLLVQGAAGAEVMMLPRDGQPSWGGIIVASGGTATINYVSGTDVTTFVTCQAGSTCTIDHANVTGLQLAAQVAGAVTITKSRFEGGAGVHVATGGNLMLTDTYTIGSSGDTITMSGGTLIMDHSDVGNAGSPGDHCAMHLNPNSTATVTRSNIRSTPYGLMIDGTTNAVFNYNNWLSNTQDVDMAASDNSGANFQHNYWDGGAAPSILQGGQFDFSNPETAMITDAGVRP